VNPRSLSRSGRTLSKVARLGAGVAALATLQGAIACRHDGAPVRKPERRSEWPIPDASEHPPCADVGDLRVCWDGATPQVRARRAPAFTPSSLGFRSVGAGLEARAVDRARDAPPFECARDVCTQRSPRMPDDGEWECADFAAVVVCRGGLAPAGVPPGGADAAFFCGPRSGGRAAPGEQVCVDLSPDVPGGATRGYRCRFVSEGGIARECRKDPEARSAGDPCAAVSGCASGMLCVSGRCIPSLPAPSCWLDDDCGKGTCRFGTCVAERT
jgi:hypothetical protein